MDEITFEHIEALLVQSLRGHHHLFDKSTLAEILRTPTKDEDFFSFENIDRVQHLFSKLLTNSSLDAKKEFLNSLDRESFEILVRTYFHILEGSILASNGIKH